MKSNVRWSKLEEINIATVIISTIAATVITTYTAAFRVVNILSKNIDKTMEDIQYINTKQQEEYFQQVVRANTEVVKEILQTNVDK